MDSTGVFCSLFLLVLFSCQHGVSYRIYILPERGSFCLGVFSGDACLSWSQYSARPILVDHSTTLIFTPGNYSYNKGAFHVANIKSFTMIGDRARILFQLYLSHIGYVDMHNLTFDNNPRVDVQYVQSFLMENCTLSQMSGYSSGDLYFHTSRMSRVVESTFVNVIIDVQGRSTLLVNGSKFSNVSGTCIRGYFSSSNVVIHSSVFVNNYCSGGCGVVFTQGSLEITGCVFDRNSAPNGAVVRSNGDLTVTNSTFNKNEAYYYQYHRGGYAIWGGRNINVSNCSFRYYTWTFSTIYSYSYRGLGGYQVYIMNSNFYHSSQSIYSSNNVTMMNSIFYNITAQSGGGGVVYSTKPVTTINCTFINIVSWYGNGGAIYSENDVKVISSNISHCSAPNGKGGAIYSAGRSHETTINPHSGPNVIFSGSNFSHNRANSGGVLYVSGHYKHHMEFNNSTFVFNEAIGDSTGGGVAFMENTSLSITNSILSNNMATIDGGVLDISFSSVRIQQSSLSQNTAEKNGGVFYGRNYSTNITAVQTLFNHNVAANGGVFYVRRFNSNIKLINSTFVENHATNQGGIMDIRGVTAVIDKNTIISNNSANVTGNVISACLSEISAYGLELQLDPIYPMYCSIYDEGYQSVTSVPTSGFTSAVEQVTSTIQASGQKNTLTVSTEQTTTGAKIKTSIQTKSSSLIPTSTSRSSDATSDAVTSDGTEAEWWNINANTSYYKTTSAEQNPLPTSQEEIMTTGEIGTEIQLDTTMDSTSSRDDGSSTTKSSITLASSNGRDNSTESISTIKMVPQSHGGTTKAIMPTLDSLTGFETHKDDDHGWTSSQRDPFQVVFLVFLCAGCIALYVIMAVLIFMACKKRCGNVRDHGYYKRMPFTDKGQDETNNEIKEHSV